MRSKLSPSKNSGCHFADSAVTLLSGRSGCENFAARSATLPVLVADVSTAAANLADVMSKEAGFTAGEQVRKLGRGTPSPTVSDFVTAVNLAGAVVIVAVDLVRATVAAVVDFVGVVVAVDDRVGAVERYVGRGRKLLPRFILVGDALVGDVFVGGGGLRRLSFSTGQSARFAGKVSTKPGFSEPLSGGLFFGI